MQILSTRFGALEVDPNSLLTFAQGLPGMEHCHQFKLLHEQDSSSLVHWLQSVEDPDITLNVVDAQRLGLRFELTLSDAQCQELSLQDPDQVAVLLLVGRDPENGQVQLKPHIPLVVNLANRRGLQLQQVWAELVFHNRAPQA